MRPSSSRLKSPSATEFNKLRSELASISTTASANSSLLTCCVYIGRSEVDQKAGSGNDSMKYDALARER